MQCIQQTSFELVAFLYLIFVPCLLDKPIKSGKLHIIFAFQIFLYIVNVVFML